MNFSEKTNGTTKPAPLTEADARQIALEYRAKFRNSEVFEAAWQALFELRTAITPVLARRFLSEELLKYRARIAGLDDLLPDAPPAAPTRHETYECPGCGLQVGQWSRDGHAADCRHAGYYELEVRFREGKLHSKSENDRG